MFADDPNEYRERVQLQDTPTTSQKPRRDTKRKNTGKVSATVQETVEHAKRSFSVPRLFSKDKGTTSRPLTEAEANEMRGPLIEAIKDYSEYVDVIGTALTADHVELVMWSDLDDREAEILADWRLRRARVHGGTATSLRQAIIWHQSVFKVLMILGPRIFGTIRHFRVHHIGGVFPTTTEQKNGE